MRVFILANGRTKSELFGGNTTPKSLLVMGQDKHRRDVTLLDMQVKILEKFNLTIYIIVGYKADEVVEYGTSHYGPLVVSGYIKDYGWEGEYSLPRTLLELEQIIRAVPGPFLLLHGDTMFNEDMIEYLIKTDGDIVRNNVGWMAVKLSPKAMDQLYKVFKDEPDIAFTHGIGPQTIYRTKDLKVVQDKAFWMFDIDRIEEWVEGKGMAKSRIVKYFNRNS